MVTNFKNEQCDLNALPKHQEVALQQLHKNYKKVVWIEAVLIGFICIVFGFVPLFINLLVEEVFDFNMFMLVGITAGVVLAILQGIIRVLGVDKKGYVLRDHDLIYKTGLINIKTTVVPFNRIQHVKVFESILLRSFGLSKLIFYTAGGNFGDLIIPGISKENADSIRAFVMQNIEKQSELVEVTHNIEDEE